MGGATVRDVFSVAAAFVALAALAVIFTSPNAVGIISASGTAFSENLRAASGK